MWFKACCVVRLPCTEVGVWRPAAEIGDGGDEVSREFLLQGQIPLLDAGVFAVTLLGVGRELLRGCCRVIFALFDAV